MEKRKWWKEAVAYEIYPRSFKDSNGDGIGDIQGIIEKLDYLQDLGIDIIWVCPIYQSPNDDNGYDISDYKAILSDFGTMEDFEALLSAVHKRGMKLIMDLVINHTSDEHEWFIESKSSKDNTYRDFYIWKEGADKGIPPNNWASIFGGSAWEYDSDTKEYYLHIFSKKQPDLNWENKEVRNKLYDMVNWWLDKGIDGFRIDAISHIKKKEGLPDLPNPKGEAFVESFDGHLNQKGIDLFLNEFVENTIKKFDALTVGEANGVTVEDAENWANEDTGYFNMIFQFEHVDLWGSKGTGLDLRRLKTTLSRWQNALDAKGWNALFIENHDLARVVSVWGNDTSYRKKSAKALATIYFFMQGTPFIYQGQEIGMTNVKYENINDYRDVASRNYYQSELAKGKAHEEVMTYIWSSGRDNSRTPMQWDSTSYAGFSDNEPWIKVNPNYRKINVEESMKDSDSIYHYYRTMIQLRRKEETFIYGSYVLLEEEHPQVFAYIRKYQNKQFLIVANLFALETIVNLPSGFKLGEKLLSNYSEKEQSTVSLNLKAYEAGIYELRER
ncbi:glycoside hydrolase family 13 protein [Marinilactibacillus psychrotolerans]|uniref:Alpha-amylase n=1 Tax=Marinilactibacillus psychrotolerans TaxID=191770 RepID=A0AAV3WVL6_9LACT|nr:alpha-glucosidase [Marinilactibacillus psychrotolerans]GEL67974.1 alpha-glucosidase [Marinilactibacillus psychrotolerans]GEQ35682.1 oligo-1,6-glucosidase [Marinilactibacillus psychrotolerans]SDD29371.1 alpha-glucosidase [Marinilactibacillus psychrotolerans]